MFFDMAIMCITYRLYGCDEMKMGQYVSIC